jgi:hypothetical protein
MDDDSEGGATTTMETANSNSWPQLKARPLISGAVLIGVGAMTALAGLIVGGSHMLAATRKWVREMEVPPSDVARAKWAQAKAAAAAGASAWRTVPEGPTQTGDGPMHLA